MHGGTLYYRAMKPTRIFAAALVVAIATWFVRRSLDHVGPPHVPLDRTFSLCILAGVLLQLAVFASSGVSGLRRVSLLWMVVALALASATTSRWFDLSAVFLAGFLFTFVPSERCAPREGPPPEN